MKSISIIRGKQFADENNMKLDGEFNVICNLPYTNCMNEYEKRIGLYLQAVSVTLPEHYAKRTGIIHKDYVVTDMSVVRFFYDQPVVNENDQIAESDLSEKIRRRMCIAFSVRLENSNGENSLKFSAYNSNIKFLAALRLIQGMDDLDIKNRTRRYMMYQRALHDLSG